MDLVKAVVHYIEGYEKENVQVIKVYNGHGVDDSDLAFSFRGYKIMGIQISWGKKKVTENKDGPRVNMAADHTNDIEIVLDILESEKLWTKGITLR